SRLGIKPHDAGRILVAFQAASRDTERKGRGFAGHWGIVCRDGLDRELETSTFLALVGVLVGRLRATDGAETEVLFRLPAIALPSPEVAFLIWAARDADKHRGTDVLEDLVIGHLLDQRHHLWILPLQLFEEIFRSFNAAHLHLRRDGQSELRPHHYC